MVEDKLPEYWEGTPNLLKRLYTYLQIGFSETNNAKVVVAGIWGLALLLNIHNVWWIVLIASILVPILVVLGRYKLYHVAKTAEYIQTTKGTVLGYRGYEIQQEQNELLKEIIKKLDGLR